MTYAPRIDPWPHQIEALQRAYGLGAFAHLLAMRCGKTKVALDEFGCLEDRGLCEDLLVIAPAAVYRTWLTAIEDHVGESLRSRLRAHVWSAGERGSAAQRREKAFVEYSGPRVLLVNVEALSGVKRAQQITLDFVSQRSCMVVVDESTTIKNIGAARTKFVVGVLGSRAKYRRILSGLPTPRSPLDLYAQFRFLDPDILNFRNYYSFKARYAVTRPMFFGGRRVDQIIGYQNVEELNERIAPHSFRVRLEDVVQDLPKKMYQVREVGMTEEQTRLYGEMLTYATTTLSNMAHVTATVVVDQMMKLHRILCGHATDEVGNVHSIPELRSQALLDLLEEHGDGKVVVWVAYDADVHRVTQVLEKEYGAGSVARFWGGNPRTREDEERRFISDDACQFMVSTPGAGGRGRRWDVADLVVYYSSTNNLEHRSQSEERTQAVEKRTSVLYVDLIVPKTVEEKILHALRSKIDLAATVMGDAWREWVV